MAKFELTIYGDDDEVIKKYETNRVRLGVVLQAGKLYDSLKGNVTTESFTAAGEEIRELLKSIFPNMTDEHAALADITDIINTFKQVLNLAGSIKGDNSKN